MGISLDRLKQIVPTANAASESGISMDRLRDIVSSPQQTPTLTIQQEQPKKSFFDKVGDFANSISSGFKEGGIPGVVEKLIPENKLQPKEVRDANFNTFVEYQTYKSGQAVVAEAELNFAIDKTRDFAAFGAATSGKVNKDVLTPSDISLLQEKGYLDDSGNIKTGKTVVEGAKRVAEIAVFFPELFAPVGVVSKLATGGKAINVAGKAVPIAEVVSGSVISGSYTTLYTPNLENIFSDKDVAGDAAKKFLIGAAIGAVVSIPVAYIKAPEIPAFQRMSAAEQAELKTTYLALAKKYHPDSMISGNADAFKIIKDHYNAADLTWLRSLNNATEPAKVTELLGADYANVGNMKPVAQLPSPEAPSGTAAGVPTKTQTNEELNKKIAQGWGKEADILNSGKGVWVGKGELKSTFDNALYGKDVVTLKKILPDIPPEYLAVDTTAKRLADLGIVAPSPTPVKVVGNAAPDITKSLPAIFIKDATKYVSAADFADSIEGSKPSDQVGTLDPATITPRDPLEQAKVDKMAADIASGNAENMPPIIIERTEGGNLQTFEGSHRVSAYLKAGKPVPVIYHGSDKIPGLTTIQEVFDASNAKTPAANPVNLDEGKETIVKMSPELSTAIDNRIKNVKNIKDVKSALSSINDQLNQAVVEAEGMAMLAQEKRAGINTADVGILKRVYSRSKAFQEGDIETMRAYSEKSRDLVNRVVENVREVHPDMSDTEAFDYALSLPTKMEETPASTFKSDLVAKEKSLSKFLDQLKQKQEELKLTEDAEALKEFQRALTTREKLSAVISVPKEQLPVGQGKEKISRLAARMRDALKNVSEEDKKTLPTFNQMNRDVQMEDAAKFITEHSEDAMKVLRGEMDPPKGLLYNSIFVAMKESALETNNIGLMLDLASLRSTRFGQEINILSKADPENPVNFIQDIKKTKIEALERRTGKPAERVIKDTVKKIRVQIPKVSKNDWGKFIDSIEC